MDCFEIAPTATLEVEGTMPVKGFGDAGGLDGVHGTVYLGAGAGKGVGCNGVGCNGAGCQVSVLELEGVNSDGR